MSLIPFILELADELHEFNRLATGGMDVDDFGFGIYPHELQTQQQPQQSQHPLTQQQSPHQRRPRSLSQLYWLSNLSKSRHHPYYRGKSCCNKTPIHILHDHNSEKEISSNTGSGVGGVSGSNSTGGDKESSANTNATNSSSTNSSSTAAAGKSAYSVVNKNGFQVSMNVKQFAPNELTVKTIDNCIVVEGQHEDKEDGHGVISRHFIRKYMLPKGYDPSEVLSTLSSDGILTVKAPPPPQKTDESMERIVSIQQTGGSVQVTQQTSSNMCNSVKADQINAASGVENAATLPSAVTGTLPVAATVTLPQQQKIQPQQLSADVECAQQQEQQQQPNTLSKPATNNKQVTCERNGNIDMNELSAEQETDIEQQAAEQTDTSSYKNVSNNNNNNNSDTTTFNSSVVNDCTTLEVGLKLTDVKEKESSTENEEKTAEIDTITTNIITITNSTTTSSIDAIMATTKSDEPMETEEDECVKENNDKKVEDIVLTKEIDDVPMENVNNVITVDNLSTTINNTTNYDSLTIVESNGIEIATVNKVDIELSSAELAGADNIIVTNNGISEEKITVTANDLKINSETVVAEIDGVTEMDAETTNVTDIVDGNGKEVNADGIGIDVDIESGADGKVMDVGGNSASVEDVNDENVSGNSLVVVAQSPPSAADLVAAADAAIILAKTQCDVDVAVAGDVIANKPTITAEKLTI